MKLTNHIHYLLLVLLTAVPNINVFAQDTFLDNFSPANYTGNDGTQNWNGGWTENDFGGTNPGAGRIRINGNRLRFRDFDSSNFLFILRNVDLSPYTDAVLTFDYNRSNGNESVGAFFLNTTTGNYDFAIGTPTGGGATGSLSFTIPALYINANSSLLFFSNSGDWGNNETVFIDNVLITATSTTPEITINDVAVNENAGTLDFTVSHTGGTTTGSFTVDYVTTNNTAVAPVDYTPTLIPNTITFPGTTLSTQTISIPIIDDDEAENAETFFLNLSNPSDGSVTITDAQGIGTINANDPIALTINDISVNEAAGTAVFTVTSSGGSLTGGYSIDYATADNTATTAGNDYTNTSSPPSLTFVGTLGETQTITVPILNDTVFEGDETYFVNLSNSSSPLVTITDNQGIGTIEDNEAGISINDISVNENAGNATFTVTLTGTVPGGFTVEYATTDASATDLEDYSGTTSPNPILTFTGTDGETQTITIPIIDDTDLEGNETFFVNLSNTNSILVTITDTQGIGTIIDDEAPFIITDTVIDNTCSGIFVDSGSINGLYSNNESITYTLCPDTPGSSVVLNFTSFDVENIFDFLQVYEGTTTTTLIDSYNNGNIPTTIISSDPSGCLTFIFSSDGSVVGNGWQANISCTNAGNSLVTLNDITVNENAGTATFTATFSGGSIPGGFSVDYTTIDDTAYADSDFVSTSGTLNFSGTPGETQTITVPIINNIFAENTEIFFLNLNNPSTTVGLISGIGTILDDGDPALGDDVPLTLFDDFNGYYDYALTAGTLRTADEGVDPCAITTSSSNTLTTPILAGSTIEKAYLTWGHSGLAADDVVTFQGQSVNADVVNTAFGFYYGMVSDVTSIINSLPDPSGATYTFTDLVIDNGPSYCGSVVFGGWSLYIFYTNPSLPAVSINMYNGFDAQGGGTTIETSSYTLDGFFAIGSTGSKTSVLSWEGDPTRTGNEIISVTTGSGTTNLTGDGNNSPVLANVFNSTIYDDTASPVINDSSLFGFDLDTYNISSLIAQGETTATTNIQTQGDFVILNSVLLKVPSNLMTGTVFEDINYPGGAGRDLASSSGVGIEGVTVELYDNTGTFVDSDVTDANGDYNIGGMANGTYTLRVVNNTVRSTRGGGATCTTCLPIQTFRSDYTASTLGTITNEIGGANPAGEDDAAGTLTANAQTISTITITNEGAVDIDFGFNFNTIVNTNGDGQGSLDQFIINSNNLDETGLDIEAHPNDATLNPLAGEDTSIFNIPITDLGYIAADGYFDIILDSGNLPIIASNNTKIDGRTQTAFSGDTNTGTVGSGSTAVGTGATLLPNYNRPEIQVRSDFGDVFIIQANNIGIRNIAVYGGNRRSIRQDSGTGNLILENFLGVNALGVRGVVGVGSYSDDGFEINGGTAVIDSNYISENTDFGISVNGGTSTLIQNNHITNNGFRNCEYNIRINNGSGVTIQNNLIDSSASTGIFDNQGNVTITENTITTAGSNTGCAQLSGINLAQNNSSVTNNIINANAGSGIALTGGTTSGNLISQNSIYANGTFADALGIDISDDGVTINDTGDVDTGPNGSFNFPVFESASISGTNLKLVGWARPGAIIEVFISDISLGVTIGDNTVGAGITQDYGEGQIYLGTITEGSGTDADGTSTLYTDADGNTDTTNRFNITLSLSSSIPLGSLITATATEASTNSTSEFGSTFTVRAATVITNRRITYRVKPN